MSGKEFRKYIFETFNFDIEKEKLIYSYLCKEKLSKRKSKLLSEDVRFLSYRAWKQYIVDKYNKYELHCLIEFDRMLSLLIRNSEGVTGFNKTIWTAYISVIFSIIVSGIMDNMGIEIVRFVIGTLSLIVFLIVLLFYVSNVFEEERKNLHFYEDVEEIIRELILHKEKYKKGEEI